MHMPPLFLRRRLREGRLKRDVAPLDGLGVGPGDLPRRRRIRPRAGRGIGPEVVVGRQADGLRYADDDVACCRGVRGVWHERRLGECFGRRLSRRYRRQGPRQRSGHFLEFRCPSKNCSVRPQTRYRRQLSITLAETRLLAQGYTSKRRSERRARCWSER